MKGKGFAPTLDAPATGCSNTRSKCQTKASPSVGINIQPTKGLRVSKNLEVSVDWLTIASEHTTHENLQQMIAFIEGYTNDEFFLEFNKQFQPGAGCKLYEHSGSSVKGCKLGWNAGENGVSHTWLSIPGGVLRQISVRDVVRLASGLHHTWKVKCRRFDSALDDYKRRVNPKEVLRACEDGDVALVGTFDPRGKTKIGQKFVPTIYFGSRESEKFLRFYNAEIKHGIPCDRWEAELKRRHAQAAFEHFVALPYDSMSEEEFEQVVSQFLAGLVIGAIDFVKFEEGVRYSRRKRLDWWASLCDEVGAGIRLSPARPKPSLERSLQWFKRQVAVVVAVLKDGWGNARFNAWLAGEISDAKKRYSPYHEAVIRQLKGEDCSSWEFEYG